MYESGRDRGQREMYPPSLEELIAENHPARVIDAFVDGLDMEYLGFTRSAPAWTGRPGYDPRALLKLYLSELDSYDESRETLHLDIPKSQMPAKLRELKERAAKYRGIRNGSSRARRRFWRQTRSAGRCIPRTGCTQRTMSRRWRIQRATSSRTSRRPTRTRTRTN